MPYRYTPKERERWINSFIPDFKSKDWHHDYVYHPSQIGYHHLFKEKKSYIEKISPKQIKGIEYAYAYNCPTSRIWNDEPLKWEDFILNLKRLDEMIDKTSDINGLIKHIHEYPDGKTVRKYGNCYFTTKGQHRLCLAKFLELDQVEVYVKEFQLDRVRYKHEASIKKYYQFLADHEMVSGKLEAISAWNTIPIKIGNSQFDLNSEFLKLFHKRFSEISRQPYLGYINFLKGILSDTENIETEDDLFKIDYHLIKRKFLLLA